MTEKIQRIRKYIVEKKHAKYRVNKEYKPDRELEENYETGVELLKRKAERFCRILEEEEVVFIPELRFIPVKTVIIGNDIVNIEEKKTIGNRYYIHEQGHVCNICPDYTEVLRNGFDLILDKIQKSGQFEDEKKREYAAVLQKMIQKIYEYTDKYADAFENTKRKDYGDSLRRVIRTGAVHFEEALQLLRLLHFFGWTEGEYHIGMGRLDQYLYPYYERDLKEGRITNEEAFEMIEEFFLTFNIDNDLYPGVQMGDNGQSVMLGGGGEGNYNKLTEMCLRASCELKLIDPKINLRVNNETEREEYIEATKLTKAGLGFPQYSNDDVVIPALEKWGYDLKDAENYTVAACWEFIIPGKGMDIPNIEAVSFPKIVNRCVEKHLEGASDFDEFLGKVRVELKEEVNCNIEKTQPVFMFPAPYLSMLMHGCVENLKDISEGCVYNNYGFHGTGIACAADSLYALKKYYFDEKKIEAKELIEAVKGDFQDDSPYLQLAREKMPHMGDGNPDVDQYAVWLLDGFADELEGKSNERGGIYRAGTGSAMYYVRHASELGASPDGRRRGEYFPANFSPSLTAKVKGPLSIIRSFTKPNLVRTANGGPLTLEFHDSVFRGEEGIEKVALLVQTFIRQKGHQLQLNATNAATLKDAQKHPENYRNLIVRVWGWSAYFVELDKVYQDHLIRRAEYMV